MGTRFKIKVGTLRFGLLTFFVPFSLMIDDVGCFIGELCNSGSLVPKKKSK